VGTTIGLVRALRAEATAKSEAETAKQVSDFLVGCSRWWTERVAREHDHGAGDPGQGATKVERELRGQPLVQARLLETMGRSTSAWASTASRGGSSNNRSPARAPAGGDHPDVGRALVQLGKAEMADSRFDAAGDRLKRAESILERSWDRTRSTWVGLYWQGLTASSRGDTASGSP